MIRWLLAAAAALCGALPAAASPADGEEISRSRGRRGGVVVLAPRIVPIPETPQPQLDSLAQELQLQLAAAAERVVGDPRLVDVRPFPQRVCPQVGCRAVAVGVMLGHQDGGCVAVGIVGPPGDANRTLVPWAGSLRLPNDQIPFRQQPEQRAVISEFVPCGQLPAALDSGPLEAAIQAALAAGG